MARYIDIEGAGIGKANREQFLVPEFADGWNAVLKILEKEPTADVVEVKHGEWKKVECGTICTNCNRVYDNDFEFLYKQIKEYFKRCPECGAKMDGGS